jgi:hypothetical protein
VSARASAGEWKFAPGPSYISGFSDVIDIYEENEEFGGYADVEINGVPVGVGFASHYQFDGGIRLGYAVGPLIVMSGDLSHTELPLYATTGFTFFPSSSVSPYIFGGFALHYVDGDYVVDDHQFTGAVFGVGIEFARNSTVSYVIEVARDTTEVDIEIWDLYTSYENGYPDYVMGSTVEPVKTYDTIVTFRVMF